MKPKEHLAIAGGYVDRMPKVPDCELPNLRLRAQLHLILAQRPELASVLPAILHHPGALKFLREIV